MFPRKTNENVPEKSHDFPKLGKEKKTSLPSICLFVGGNLSKIFKKFIADLPFEKSWVLSSVPKPNQREVFFFQKSKGPERPSGHKWTWPLPTDPSRSLDWDHHRSSRCSSVVRWRVRWVRGVGLVGWLPKSVLKTGGEGSSPHHQNPDVWSVWIS